MRRKNLLKVVGVIVVAAVLAIAFMLGCAEKAPAPAPKVYEWRWFDVYTPRDWGHGQVAKLMDEVEKETGGRLKIEVFAMGEHPYASADMLKVVKERKAEVVGSTGGYVGGVEPVAAIYSLPMLLPPDIETTRELLYATQEEVLRPIWDRWNCECLFTYFWPPQYIHANVAVTSWDSLRGKSIRAWSAPLVEFVNVLNGEGVVIEFGEVPTALGTGLLDGVITSAAAAYDLGLYDYVDYLTMIPICLPRTALLVNKDALAELDSDTRQTLLKVFAEAESSVMKGYMDEGAKAVNMCVEDLGAIVVEPSPKFLDEIREKCEEEVWPSWLEGAGAEGEKALSIIEKEMGR